MQVVAGQTVKLRDGRVVFVTDAYDYLAEWVDEAGNEVKMPNDYILVGQLYDARLMGWSKDTNTVVTDMSEVVSILE